MKRWLGKIINKAGYSISRHSKDLYQEYRSENEFMELYTLCQPFTMTSIERMYSLYKATGYVLNNDIKGDFVECGVWRGGSSMLIAGILQNRNITDRKIYLYDTFEGMPPPSVKDVDYRGKKAEKLMKKTIHQKETSIWCLADLAEVSHNMGKTGYPKENIIYVQGKVEDTIPSKVPDRSIALLRLDTDWYESTWHELVHLFPLLTKNGVLIIDDYGHWEGCRKAVDDYFEKEKVGMLLHRIDYTGRIGIKSEK